MKPLVTAIHLLFTTIPSKSVLEEKRWLKKQKRLGPQLKNTFYKKAERIPKVHQGKQRYRYYAENFRWTQWSLEYSWGYAWHLYHTLNRGRNWIESCITELQELYNEAADIHVQYMNEQIQIEKKQREEINRYEAIRMEQERF